jgi:NADPH:quinone reductase-like Zn-dependent oxidoreductase/NADP-dependent 3-hydroxy acid dehydrogenase YdfG/acyl carrier protein
MQRHGPDAITVALACSSAARLAAGHLLDPAVLDGALQALLFFTDSGQTEMMLLPWRFGRIRLLRRGVAPAMAVVQAKRRGPRSLCADITLLDTADQVVAVLSDCWFVALREVPRTVADPYFRIALVPDLIQAATAAAPDLAAILAALPPGAPGGSVLLAETALALFLAAADSGGALAAHADAWLQQDFPDRDDRPAADALWRTVFYDVPQAVAEAVLVAHFATPADAPFPAALLDQMLTASPTAQAATTALLAAVAAHLAGRDPAAPIRLCVIGVPHSAFARGLLDMMERHGAPLRALFIAATDEHEAALGTALAGRHGVVVMRHAPIGAGFDLVLGIWPHSTAAAMAPPASAALLAPGGLALVAEADAGRLATAARLAGVFDPDGIDAPTLAEAWQRAGLLVAPPHGLAAEIWPACLVAAVRPAEPMPSYLPASLPDDEGAALARRLPDGGWMRLEALGDGRKGGAMMLLLPAATPDLATLLADITQLALSGVAARLWVVTRGAGPLAQAIAGLRRVIANECPDLDCRVLHLAEGAPGAAAFVAAEAAAPGDEPEVILTSHGRFVPRLRTGPGGPPAVLPAARLVIPRPGLLSGLGWEAIAPTPLGPDGVEIAVAAAGLNFRDVMSALGLLPDEALLDGFGGPTLGLECSGTVTAIGTDVTGLAPGDRVIAIAPSALATTVVTRRYAVLRLPDEIDLVAAATLPVAFMTAVYALGHLARLRPGERVLIHGAAGGVGLAALQYALHRRAIVYVTAGTAARRGVLLRLGAAAAFDSRALDFADDLLAATGGEGVDVVLNSLSGAAMERSLQLLRPFGRFLEIGKRDLYADSRIGLRAMRHNVSYFAIDADELAARRPEDAAAVLTELADLLAQGAVAPLPFRCFGFDAAEEAFRLMQASGHIGKILLTPTPITRPATAPGFTARADGVYVVTGGLGGFGLATARWLAANGARHLALISRRGPDGADGVLAAFARDGVTATAYGCDVADRPALARTLDAIRRAGQPIRGVVHAAMVLADGLLPEQDTRHFAAALRPKLAGATALDALTRGDPLGLFLLYSSIATSIGNPGQANYVAANAAMEVIIAARRAEGLPGLAVRWGPIGDLGTLAADRRVSEMLADLLGSPHMTAAEALALLPAALAQPDSCIGIAAVQWPQLRHQLPAALTALLAEQPARARRQAHGPSLLAQLADLPQTAARDLLVSAIAEELALVLRLPASAIPLDAGMLGLGLDSLMAVELRIALEGRIGLDLPMLVLTEDMTLKSFAERILLSLRGGAADDTEALILRHEGGPAGPPLPVRAEAGP